MINKKNLLIIGLFVFLVILFSTIGVPKGDNTDLDPCKNEISRKNSVEEIEKRIADCETSIEQTSLEYDEVSKKMEIQLNDLKQTNFSKRNSINRVRKEILGLSLAPTEGAKKE